VEGVGVAMESVGVAMEANIGVVVTWDDGAVVLSLHNYVSQHLCSWVLLQDYKRMECYQHVVNTLEC
jgi:hypothetical protein